MIIVSVVRYQNFTNGPLITALLKSVLIPAVCGLLKKKIPVRYTIVVFRTSL